MVKSFIKRILCRVDNQFEASLYERAVKLEKSWYSSDFLNLIRRSISPAIVRCRYKLGIRDKNPLKLHLGCGNQYFKGYVNIDQRKTPATGLVCNIGNLPYPDDSTELIETYHAIEHFPRHNLPQVLEEWHRVLVPGGKLIIECPNFDEAVKRYIGDDNKMLDSIFGLQRFPGDAHLWGFNFGRLKKLLDQVGFKDIQRDEPQDYHTESEPCLRVECIKGVRA